MTVLFMRVYISRINRNVTLTVTFFFFINYLLEKKILRNMNNLTKFGNHGQYVQFKRSDDFVTPNVSWCTDENKVHYNKQEEAFVFRFTPLYGGEKIVVTDSSVLNDGVLTRDVLETNGLTSNSLGVLEIGNYVKTIHNGTCSQYSGLKKVIISDSVTSVGNQAFMSCVNLTSVIIKGPASIGTQAFSGCYSLSEIVMDDVTSLGSNSFQSCQNLKKVIIPAGVTTIADDTFSGCSNLASLSVDPFNSVYDSRDNCNAVIKTGTNQLVLGCINTVIPSSVVGIGSAAFRGSNITSITIPTNVSSIGSYAFSDCGELTTVEIEGSISTFNQYVFYNCANLTTLTTQTPATYVYGYAFDGCSKLQTISLAQNCQVATHAFYGCSSLTSIGNQGIKLDGSYVFYDCSSLETINLYSGPSQVQTYTFYNCSSLTSITIPSSYTSIAQNAFSNCSSLASLELSTNITTIGNQAFYGCSSLTSLTIPKKTITLGTDTFANCSSLTSISVVSGNSKYDSRDNCNAIIVTATNSVYLGCTNTVIPNTVTSINQKAFYGSGITSVTIPDSVKTIYANAFEKCSDLTTVTIGSGVTTINNCAFIDCVSLSTINFNATNCSDFSSGSANVFYNDTNISNVNIGNGVQKIPNYFVNGKSNITSITIPNSVTTIGSSAFNGCTGLTSLTLGTSVTTINASAFNTCTGLTTITIPESVTTISGLAFANCTNVAVLNFNAINCGNFASTPASRPFYNTNSLSTINIGSNVTRIPDYMIRNSVPGNKQITCEAVTPPSMNTNETIAGIPAANLISYIHVPSESVDTYKANSGWSRLSSKISAIA